MARGVERAGHQAEVCPVGDGGEGTMDAVLAARKGTVSRAQVTGPLGEPVEARWAMLEDGIGLVELAEASGLMRVPPSQRDPLRATTFGTGELTLAAMAGGAREVILFVGGSATIDGGAGAAQALGVRYLDAQGSELTAPIGGGDLERIARVVRPTHIVSSTLRIACDVRNPLLGVRGAAAVYGPQKGANPQQIAHLESGLTHWANILGGDPDTAGAGAAGGAPFGLRAIFGAKLIPGADLVFDLIRFDDRLVGIDFVLTGEGRLDEQTLEGKALLAVARAAARATVRTIAMVGSTDADSARQIVERGFVSEVLSISETFGMEESLHNAEACLEELSYRIVSGGIRD